MNTNYQQGHSSRQNAADVSCHLGSRRLTEFLTGPYRARNITDTLVRLGPAVTPGEVQHVTARLFPCAHRLLAGHRLRLRLQLSGGAHPHYARNPAPANRWRPGLA